MNTIQKFFSCLLLLFAVSGVFAQANPCAGAGGIKADFKPFVDHAYSSVGNESHFVTVVLTYIREVEGKQEVYSTTLPFFGNSIANCKTVTFSGVFFNKIAAAPSNLGGSMSLDVTAGTVKLKVGTLPETTIPINAIAAGSQIFTGFKYSKPLAGAKAVNETLLIQMTKDKVAIN